MATSGPIDADTAHELMALMNEFPDWKKQFPDLYEAISVNSRRDIAGNNTVRNGSHASNDLEGNQHSKSRRVVFDDEKNHPMMSQDIPAYSRHAAHAPVGIAPRTRISTTMDHYKWWNADPSPPFCEMPTFSNYLLYPGRGRHFQTTTQAFFKGTPGSRPPMTIPRDESTDLLGLITSRGDQSLATKTTTGLAFQPYKNVRPAEKIDRTPADTSYLTRYSEYSDRQQGAPTWQNIINTHEGAKFDGVTVNSETYRQWPIGQRQPYGDRHESPFAPSTTHFDGRTTNSLTYRGEQLNPATDRVQPAGVAYWSRGAGGQGQTRGPLHGPESQPNDYDTAYKSDFNQPNAVRLLSKSQALMLLRALRERKQKRDANNPAAAVADIVATATATKPKGLKKTSPKKGGGVTIRAN